MCEQKIIFYVCGRVFKKRYVQELNMEGFP
jgi:hypothetical protein